MDAAAAAPAEQASAVGRSAALRAICFGCIGGIGKGARGDAHLLLPGAAAAATTAAAAAADAATAAAATAAAFFAATQFAQGDHIAESDWRRRSVAGAAVA